LQKKLYHLTTEYEKLRAEIKVKQDNLTRLNDEYNRVLEEKTSVEKTNKKLKQQMEEYRVPQVLDYVKLNAELYDIQKKIKDWTRKVEIAQMALKKEVSIYRNTSKSGMLLHDTISVSPNRSKNSIS
jgi:predicted nuclease with TOPRIM domain